MNDYRLSRRAFAFGALASLPAFSAFASDVLSAPFGKGVARPAVRDVYEPAPLARQRIAGCLGERIAVNLEKRLLEGVDVDVLLQGYRHRPGQQTWIGEHCAKFIDAATHTWALTHDERLKAKLDRAVRELIATQESDGYLGTYLLAERWKDWDVWAHKYNVTALLNYYAYTGYEPALEACRKMGDLLVRTYGDGKRDIVVGDWHVGMANSSVLGAIVDLYRFTGQAKYLALARSIVAAWDHEKGPKIISTLLATGSVYKVANGKAYEMMSCITGLVDLYRMTGDRQYLTPVEIAWNDIVKNRLYLTGTASWDEHFHDDHWLRADDKDADAGVGEGCVTVTWMQLNLQLLRLTGDAKYAAQLERSLYNALTAAQHPQTGLICYFVPLDGHKRYGEVSHGVPGVSCCTSSIPRGIALIPAIAFGLRNGAPTVNLYTAGEAVLRVGSTEVNIVSRTGFPSDNIVELTVSSPQRQRFTLALRVPEWTRKFTATVGDRTYRGVPGEYLEITRPWHSSDVVHVDIDLSVQIVAGAPSYPGRVAVQRGPQILAVEQAVNPEVEIWAVGVEQPPQLKFSIDALPAGWRGRQAYTALGFDGNAMLGKRAKTLVLTPFADAGQSRGEYRVWLES